MASLVGDIGTALDAALGVDLDVHFAEDDDGLADELVAVQCQLARMEALRARLIARCGG